MIKLYYLINGQSIQIMALLKKYKLNYSCIYAMDYAKAGKHLPILVVNDEEITDFDMIVAKINEIGKK